MNQKLQQIIREETMKLPKEMQDVINGFDWIKITDEIGKKYKLNDQELNSLQVETLLVLIGLEFVDTYAQNVEENVGITREESEKIAKEVVEKIFIPINETIIENIRKNLNIKNQKPEQNLNFILSGGDYGAFIDPERN